MNNKTTQEVSPEREAFEKLINPVIENIAVSDKKYEYGINSILTAFDMVVNSALANKPEAEPICYTSTKQLELAKKREPDCDGTFWINFDENLEEQAKEIESDTKQVALYPAPPSTAALQKRIEELEALKSACKNLLHVFDNEKKPLLGNAIGKIRLLLTYPEAGDVQAPKEVKND